MTKRLKRLAGALPILVLLLALLPGLSLTAYADEAVTFTTIDGGKTATCDVTVSAPTAYAAYKPRSTDDADALAARQVIFNGYPWYVIEDNSAGVAEGTLTLLAADTSFGLSPFNTNSSFSYNSSTVKSMLDALTESGASFADAAKAIQPLTLTTYQYGSNTEVYETTENAKLYLLSTQEAEALPQNVLKLAFPGITGGAWWLRSPGEIVNSYGTDLYYIACVLGDYGLVLASSTSCQRALGVRPAIKLDLSAVDFSSESNTFLLPQTITAADVTVTYGDTGKSVSAETDGGGEISYAVKEGSGDYIEVDASTGALTVKRVPADGKACVTVTAAETDVYGTATKDVTVTINRADAAAASVAANDRGYDAAEQPLVTVTGEATGGTMYYALGTDAATPPADNLYTTSVPGSADAGTYYVWYRIVGDENHKDVAAVCVTVRIVPFGPATFTLPASTGTVGESAFEGDTSVTIVDAQRCTALGANAFKGCTSLTQIRLPKNCSIDATAFTGCTGLSGIFAPAGGTTETWCKNNGVAFFAEQPDA